MSSPDSRLSCCLHRDLEVGEKRSSWYNIRYIHIQIHIHISHPHAQRSSSKTKKKMSKTGRGGKVGYENQYRKKYMFKMISKSRKRDMVHTRMLITPRANPLLSMKQWRSTQMISRIQIIGNHGHCPQLRTRNRKY